MIDRTCTYVLGHSELRQVTRKQNRMETIKKANSFINMNFISRAQTAFPGLAPIRKEKQRIIQHNSLLNVSSIVKQEHRVMSLSAFDTTIIQERFSKKLSLLLLAAILGLALFLG